MEPMYKQAFHCRLQLFRGREELRALAQREWIRVRYQLRLLGTVVFRSLSGFRSKLLLSRRIPIESLPIRQFSSSVCEAVEVRLYLSLYDE